MNTDVEAQIRERAYLIWEREDRPSGKAEEHWMCAKAEVEAELLKETAGKNNSSERRSQE
jgi:hypothetical protein